MGRDLRLRDKSLSKSCRGMLPRICSTAVSISLVYLASVASGQTSGSPVNRENAISKSAPQICDGQQPNRPNQLSLNSDRTLADPVQSSNLQTEPVAHPLETKETNPRDYVATQQQPLQCLRSQSHQGAEASGTEDGVAPVMQSSPQITLDGRTITVDPHAASLGRVLDSIRTIAGFELVVPPSGMEGKVFDQIGPLPVREALVQLLYGSGYNYIIQTSPDDPQDVTHVFVSARMGTRGETAEAAPAQTMTDEAAEDQALYGGFADPSAHEETVPHAGLATQTPAQNTANVPGVPAGFNLKQAAEDAHKSPAQILEELQKRQIEILDAQSPPPQ